MMGPGGAPSPLQLPGVHDMFTLLRLIEEPKRYKKAIEDLKGMAEDIGERLEAKDLAKLRSQVKTEQARITELATTAQSTHDNLIAEAQLEAKRIVETAKVRSDELLAQTEGAHKLAAASLREAAEAEKASKKIKAEAERAHQAASQALRDAEGQKRTLESKMKQFQALASSAA